jgi:3-hydroxyisobutyrate dehydrogenase
MVKDVAIALDLARDEGLPVPLSALAQQLWRAAAIDAAAAASVSEMARWIERQASTPLTPGAAPAGGGG